MGATALARLLRPAARREDPGWLRAGTREPLRQYAL